jgi:hypothetical protein
MVRKILVGNWEAMRRVVHSFPSLVIHTWCSSLPTLFITDRLAVPTTMEYFSSEGPSGAGEDSLKGCTLVLAAVGVGNVGQLAADLLISTLALPRCGSFEDPHVLPCVGCATRASGLV